MRILKKLLFILLAWSCTNENPNKLYIETYNMVFGVNNTKVIDKIIDYGDSLLLKAYDQHKIEVAYKLFLNDIQNNRIDSFDIGLTNEEMENFINLFEINNLKNEIWSFSERDGREVFSIAYNGKFLNSFEKLIDKDRIALDYFDMYGAGGGISYPLLAGGILENELNNYLIKRIVIVDVLYRNLTNTAYNKALIHSTKAKLNNKD